VLSCETFSTFANEHHVRTLLENAAGKTNRVFDAMQAGDGTGFEGGRIHDDGVAFHLAIESEMRAVTRVKDGIVFENSDGGFDGIESMAA
jgi:hypothetical protein